MPYRYSPPTASPGVSRSDLEDEFRRWNRQAGETVVSDYDLPMMHPGQTAAEVRFLLRGQPMHVRIEQWGDFATNLRCAYLNIRDMRLAEARGSLEAMRETLLGLPAPRNGRDPWEVLGLRPDASADDIEDMYRSKARRYHPDTGPNGGDPERFAELTDAYEQLKARAS